MVNIFSRKFQFNANPKAIFRFSKILRLCRLNAMHHQKSPSESPETSHILLRRFMNLGLYHTSITMFVTSSSDKLQTEHIP